MAQASSILFVLGVIGVALGFAAHVGHAVLLANGRRLVAFAPARQPAFATGGVTRAWTDVNHNYQPDCDLLNPAAQNLSASGGDICGPISNQKFGQNVFTNSVDPALLKGWGVRPSDWSTNISVQQQILSRASVEIA